MPGLRPIRGSRARVEAVGAVTASAVPTEGGPCVVAGVRVRGDLARITASLDGAPCPVDHVLSGARLQVSVPDGSGVGHVLELQAPNASSVTTTVDYAPPAIQEMPLSTIPTLGGSLVLRGANFGSDPDVLHAELRSHSGLVVPCGAVHLTSLHKEVILHVPPGVGADWRIHLFVAGQPATCPILYAAPEVTHVKPAPVAGGDCTVQGTNFGEDAAELRAVLAGAALQSIGAASPPSPGAADCSVSDSLPVRLVQRHVRVEVTLPRAADAPSQALSVLYLWVGDQRVMVPSPYAIGGPQQQQGAEAGACGAGAVDASPPSPDMRPLVPNRWRNGAGAGQAQSPGQGMGQGGGVGVVAEVEEEGEDSDEEESEASDEEDEDEEGEEDDDPAIVATDGFEADDLLSELFGARSSLADGDAEEEALLSLVHSLQAPSVGQGTEGGRRPAAQSASELDGQAALLSRGAPGGSGRLSSAATAAAAGAGPQGAFLLPRDAWTQDVAAEDCELCARPFTLLRRRHHCRRCGRLACHRCSSHSLWSAEKGDYVRVCSVCWRTVELRTRLLQCIRDVHLMAEQLPPVELAEAQRLFEQSVAAAKLGRTDSAHASPASSRDR